MQTSDGVSRLSLFVCRRFCDGRASKVHQILLAFNRATPTNTSQMTSITQFHHISPRTRIWFGTRGSEVQILSPRPINSNYLRRCQTRQDRPTWFWPRSSSLRSSINTAIDVLQTVQRSLQNRPQCCDGKTRWPRFSQTAERTLNSPKRAGDERSGSVSAHRAFLELPVILPRSKS